MHHSSQHQRFNIQRNSQSSDDRVEHEPQILCESGLYSPSWCGAPVVFRHFTLVLITTRMQRGWDPSIAE